LTRDEKRKLDELLEKKCKKLCIPSEDTNMEELKEIIKPYYNRMVKDDLNNMVSKTIKCLHYEMTNDEKKSILNRFNNVKTINEGKALYAAIKAELNESKRTTAPIVEKQFVTGQQSLNETTIYSNTENPSLDLMNRMDNLYTK
jgi:hypothetical protein